MNLDSIWEISYNFRYKRIDFRIYSEGFFFKNRREENEESEEASGMYADSDHDADYGSTGTGRRV